MLSLLPAGFSWPSFRTLLCPETAASPTEFHLHPKYRTQRPLDAVLKKVQAGLDDFVTEKYHDGVAAILAEWSSLLLDSPQKTAALERVMSADFAGVSLKASIAREVHRSSILTVAQMRFAGEVLLGRDAFLEEWRSSMKPFSKLLVAEFQVTGIRPPSPPLAPGVSLGLLETQVRFELVGVGADFHREQRIGNWTLEWEMLAAGEFHLRKWRALDETRSRSTAPVFEDISSRVFGENPSYSSQLIPGTDHWRTVLDGACGIDIYGHNGISIGDVDGDGFDDLYICQPAGLPNLLFRNRGDGTFEDITANSGVGLLDNTACALFADVDNDGRQDLIVVRTNGPLLFLNQGGGKFRRKPDAFQFANPPQGTFTGAAIADYDRDGWLDIYFCLYVYYQGSDQYRYPAPYYDAENGPPNFMMRNNRDGSFRDVTRESGLDKNNTRFSFCCAWGDDNGDGWPDLYVVNDFGRKNLYRNNGDGTFTDIAPEAGLEDVGAGMGVCWLDYDGDGKEDLYVANMWTAAGKRISQQDIFQKNASGEVRAFYRKHAMGNSLFDNRGGGRFADAGSRAGTAMGRWSWSSDAWDFDRDGCPDLYIANGMISGTSRKDLNSFFWRQVVANSPVDSKSNHPYEQGWNAINELIRSDGTWSGFERNIFYLNNRDGTFSDVSGIVGLDFIEDSRTFALADFDHDGRTELVLKNRNGPQMRFVKNVMPDLAPAIAFRLTGKKSNRDAIGAAVTVTTESGSQTRRLQAGSGFLAQHTKELHFGLGQAKSKVNASIRWPGGLVQELRDLPLNHRICVEEGSPPSRMEAFRPFASPSAHKSLHAEDKIEAEPVLIETWLLSPVLAPDFSLPNLTGSIERLSARRGKPVLLHFNSAGAPGLQRDLEDFQEVHARWAKEGLQLLAVIVGDTSPPDEMAFSFHRLSFPILRASEEIAAIYNILYRFLFDRHRDLSLPASFLIDEQGAVVKIYQGPVPKAHFEKDFRNIPKTVDERLARALPFPGVSETFDFVRNNLSYGSVFYERGYLEQAEEFCRLVLREDSSNAEALYAIGSVYLQRNKSKEARETFERVLKLQAKYPGTLPNAWNNLGILAARQGREEEAVGNFQRALEIDPDHVIALENLGSVYRQQKRWDDAKRVLQRALQWSPEEPEANYGMAMVFAQLNDTDNAYTYLQRALAARPVYPEALNNLGILYLRTRRPDDAVKTFQECIRVGPAYDQAYLNLARVYAIEGDMTKARAVLLELLKQHPGHAQAERELGKLSN